jgi:hypothetical protein
VLGVCILGIGLEKEKFTILVYKLLDVFFRVAVQKRSALTTCHQSALSKDKCAYFDEQWRDVF